MKRKLLTFALIAAVLVTPWSYLPPRVSQAAGGEWVLIQNQTQIEPDRPRLRESSPGSYPDGSYWKFEMMDGYAYLEVQNYSIISGEFQYKILLEFSFDSPPQVLPAGETISLNIEGLATVEGELGNNNDWMGLSYEGKSSPSINPKNERLETSFTAEIAVPANGDDGRFMIQATASGLKCGEGAPCYVRWFYEFRGEATPAPATTVDCSIPLGDQAEFDRTWMKYSDFDDAIPMADRNNPAKRWDETANWLTELAVDTYNLEARIEEDGLMRELLGDYRQKIVTNQKQNLIKAFLRLSYVTYTTIKSGSDLGRGYAKLFTPVDGAEQLGNTLNVIKGLTPPAPSSTPPSLAGDLKGQLLNVPVGIGINALTAQSPQEFGAAVFNEFQNASGSVGLGSADISDEEITILRLHHMEKRVVDIVLQDSVFLNGLRRKQVETNKRIMEGLEGELEGWLDAEKARVAGDLLLDCERRASQ